MRNSSVDTQHVAVRYLCIDKRLIDVCLRYFAHLCQVIFAHGATWVIGRINLSLYYILPLLSFLRSLQMR